MKKFMLTVFCLLASLALVACGGTKEAEYKLGMGVNVSLDSSKEGLAQVDATVASVVTDKDGKIVICRLDVAQNKGELKDGKFTVKNLESKMELKERYGMAAVGNSNLEIFDNDKNGVVKEWYEQAMAFEAFVVGKTAEEVKNLKTQEMNNHIISADKELLDAGCSIVIDEFKDAVVKACNDEQGMNFKTAAKFTLGLAATSFVDPKTVDAVADNAETADVNEAKDGLVAMYSDFATTVLADGKVLAALNDAIQPNISFNVANAITKKEYTDTKRNLKEKYGMAAVGNSNLEIFDNDKNGVVKEWFEQSAAFSNYVVGMAGQDVKNIKTQSMNNHVIAADKALLDAGCSIQITDIIAVVAKSVNNNR